MRNIKSIILVIALMVCCIGMLGNQGCDQQPSSDDIQRKQQERILQEGTAQIGMPDIKNFREKKILKDILELRDQEGLITYTYIENQIPREIPGKTALGGKLTFFGQTVGYGLPYATQYTNPQKTVSDVHGITSIPQADPNGLFSPASAEGTWVLMLDPNGSGKVSPIYVEPRIVVSPFKLKSD